MKLVTTSITTLFYFLLIGQNLEKIGSNNAIKLNGSIGYSMAYNSNYGNQMTQRPLSWNLQGRLNISIIDLQIPFTFSFSNYGTKFTQPTYITSIDPKYKWFQGHFGQTTMSISSNTIQGRPFLGGGIELNFKKIKFKAMFGRLNKSVFPGSDSTQVRSLTYTRLGGAISAFVKIKNSSIEFILFKAKDLKNSIPTTFYNSKTHPMDNFILETKLDLKVFRKVNIKVDYALNFITQNTEIETAGYNSNTFDFLIQKNVSTQILHYINTDLSYQLKNMNFGISYERIDPNFQSLGNYFTNNDLEKVTLKSNCKFFKNVWSLSMQVGFQRNNLTNQSKSKSQRLAVSFQNSILLTKKMSLQLSYSNFSNLILGKDPTDLFYNEQFDSLKIYVSNQNASLVFMNRMGKNNQPQLINFISNFSQTTNYQGPIEQPSIFGTGISKNLDPTTILSNTLSYSLQFKRTATNIQLSVNHIFQKNSSKQSQYIGPSLKYNQKVFKKNASIGMGSMYAWNKIAQNSNHLLSHQFSFNYTPKLWNEKYGTINLSVNLSLLQKILVSNNKFENQYSIFLQLNYSY
ncbi:MAG: hypothetical protein R2799_04990 [Crocinitomicaceae bacterium]